MAAIIRDPFQSTGWSIRLVELSDRERIDGEVRPTIGEALDLCRDERNGGYRYKKTLLEGSAETNVQSEITIQNSCEIFCSKGKALIELQENKTHI